MDSTAAACPDQPACPAQSACPAQPACPVICPFVTCPSGTWLPLLLKIVQLIFKNHQLNPEYHFNKSLHNDFKKGNNY